MTYAEIMKYLVVKWGLYKLFVKDYYKRNPQEIMNYDKEYSMDAFMSWLENNLD